MKLQTLFEMCHNLGLGTIITVRDFNSMKIIDIDSYERINSIFGDKEIIYFSIDDLRHATVYMEGVA